MTCENTVTLPVFIILLPCCVFTFSIIYSIYLFACFLFTTISIMVGDNFFDKVQVVVYNVWQQNYYFNFNRA